MDAGHWNQSVFLLLHTNLSSLCWPETTKPCMNQSFLARCCVQPAPNEHKSCCIAEQVWIEDQWNQKPDILNVVHAIQQHHAGQNASGRQNDWTIRFPQHNPGPQDPANLRQVSRYHSLSPANHPPDSQMAFFSAATLSSCMSLGAPHLPRQWLVRCSLYSTARYC